MSRPLGVWTRTRLAVALASFLPFAPGLATGGCFYFRDLSSYFFDARRFVLDGLWHGEIRRWNPYVNEGSPVMLSAVGYPGDWLQALVPNEWGISLLLALHVPLAALTCLGLGRRLGCRPAAAAVGALVYALCGFTLSSLNLYIHLEAIAWAPLAISLLMEAADGGWRSIGLAAGATALCLSTTGVEIAAQGAACALVLSAARDPRRLARLAASALLALGLAASPLVDLVAQVLGSQRSAGLRTSEVLAHSVHPVSLLQTLIAGLFGDPITAGFHYWGGRFASGQFPYFVSLYLGAAAVGLAAIGARARHRHGARLVLLLVLGLTLSLGRYARLDMVLGLVPALGAFRFPVKAFFSVVVSVSLLASLGAERLAASREAWRSWLWLAAALALAVLLVGGAPGLPGVLAGLADRFFPNTYPPAMRVGALQAVAADAAAEAATLLALAGLAVLALRGRLSTQAAVVATAAVIAADLVRAGAGLNPVAPAALYRLSPEMSQVAERLRRASGRVFTCYVHAMPSFNEASRLEEHGTLWSTAVWRESLSPYANVPARIETTGSDATALVASRFSMSSGEAACQQASALQYLRASGVRFVLSVQPFTNEELRLVDVAAPARTAPLSIYVYELAGHLADPSVSQQPDDIDPSGRARAIEGAVARYVEDRPGFVRVRVATARAAWLIVRRKAAAGWSATVDAHPTTLRTANGRHQAVAVPAGTSEVVLRYHAPLAGIGAALSLASLGLAVALVRFGRA